ncbi:MAG: rhodanese-like domain-containing protein [Flavobacteriaceae bacterium]|nr:rhodanese-like domain-containing protein [Flavobacteriaceae bacterium]
MKNLSLLLIGLLMIPMFLLTSCDRGVDAVDNSTPKFNTLKDYVVANNLDLDKILTSTDGISFVVDAPAASADVTAFLNTYYIMDLRSAADFATGRVAGAKNVAFANILTDATAAKAAGNTKDILVICYTGQTATYATALLRLYGFKNTRALKWGMSGWNPTFDKYTAGTGNLVSGSANWTNVATPPTPPSYDPPTITSTATDGLAILKQRVEAVVADGTKTVTPAAVVANPSGYYLNNYKIAADYAGYGHFTTSYRIQPLTLALNNHLNINPSPTAQVVTYCYTGQTSGVVTAFLRVMGYNAFSMNFGMNGLWNDNPFWPAPPSGNKWVASRIKSYPTVTN